MNDDMAVTLVIRQMFRRLAGFMKWIMRIVGPAALAVGIWAQDVSEFEGDIAVVLTYVLLGLGWSLLGWLGKLCNPRNSELVYFRIMIAIGIVWMVATFFLGLVVFAAATLF